MQLSVQFNWPMDQESATATLDMCNVEDSSWEYRAGVLLKERPGKIWCPEDWQRGNADFVSKSFIAKKGDEIVVERRSYSGGEVELILRLDVQLNWPAEAGGPSTVHTSWNF